jgi:hypothetical protein
MEHHVLQPFKLTVQVDILSMEVLVFFKVKFNALKEHGMEQAVLLFLMGNVQLISLGMVPFVSLMFQLLALKDIHLMELCVFQLFLVFVLKDMFKEEINAIDKHQCLAQEMLDGMEQLV